MATVKKRDLVIRKQEQEAWHVALSACCVGRGEGGCGGGRRTACPAKGRGPGRSASGEG